MKGGPDDPPLPVAILLDDVTVPADDMEAAVMGAADAINRLCRAGAMVGLYKGMIGATETEFMGSMWASGGKFRPLEERVSELLERGEAAYAAMPRAQLYGMLSFWRQYIPDFSSKTRRLRGLLGQDAGDWTADHTAEVEAALKELLAGVPCINFDPQQPVLMEVHTGPKGLGAVCL